VVRTPAEFMETTSTDNKAAQSQPKGDSGFETAGTDDFLSREKALLGDDADQFATGNDNAAFVSEDDDDLLGGGDANGGEEVIEFESSFPAIDTRNDVRMALCNHFGIWTDYLVKGCSTRRTNHQLLF